ncbi:hypothetical protein FISHEDRAFT_75732 [Fistulina hepatica ATCC 64428]|uniref:YABBY protein C-terminal domain-containing protein n=1 Tax=Fistulina hepatica ATCC 64428 TaxID=1128425 RepID=A0A0D7A8R6_9AGAR|nr:hypothetical protein FISHEDRAFT_75732 [Fistulina hepatica ATCC 64428]
MPPQKKAPAVGEKPKKTKSSSGSNAGKKKLSAFNKFMKSELARLKEERPDITHQERFKLATSNWKTAKVKA